MNANSSRSLNLKVTGDCTRGGSPPNKRDDILFMCFVRRTKQIAFVHAVRKFIQNLCLLSPVISVLFAVFISRMYEKRSARARPYAKHDSALYK